MKTAVVLTVLGGISLFASGASAQNVTRETIINVATANGHAYACGDAASIEQGVKVANWLTRNHGQRQALTYAFVAGAASNDADAKANCPQNLQRWKDFVATVSAVNATNQQIMEAQTKMPAAKPSKAVSDWSSMSMMEGKFGA